jgi:hypothetical protein
MGYAISWIAFKDTTVAQAAGLLGLSLSGQTEEEPESMFCGVHLDSGWSVVFINEYAHTFVRDRTLQQVSAAAYIVAASIEEHVMFSSSEGWENGNLIWKVTHAFESGPRHLQEHGSLPKEYLSVKQRLLAAQQREDENSREVDYVFDVPLELAEAIVGFKHDKVIDASFEVLEPAREAPTSSGLLSRLFRKTRETR